MAVSLTICNLALGDLRASGIGDISEASLEAQMCARYYPHALQVLLDTNYAWSFATRIAALAERSTNDRSSEWTKAYSLPADCAQPLRLVWPANLSNVPVRRYWPYPWPANPNWGQDFVVEGGVLFTQVEGAVLEYASTDVDETAMPAPFKEALRKRLAAELAVPLRDSREMKGDLLKEAEIAKQEAIANDRNRQPTPSTMDDVAWARTYGL